jgi:protoporphyrinogen oxidase
MRKKRIAIIGAGISGLTTARILKAKGYSPVIFEKESKPGGLIRCSEEEGNLFHHVGGIVFNTKIDKIKTWFQEQFDFENEFIPARRNAKILYNDQYIGYPVENYLYQLPDGFYGKIIKELALNVLNSNHVSNFEDFLRKKFGETLFELYFRPYNEKIWNFDLKMMPLSWLEGKLPMPDFKEIVISNLLKRPEKKMVHSTFFYPRKGGSSFIADRLAEGTEIVFNTAIDQIKKSGDQWSVQGDQFDAVVYTGDVRKLAQLLNNVPDGITGCSEKVTDLPSNGTSNVLCYTDDSDLSWLYIPGQEYRCHRIVYTGNMSPANNSKERKTCLVEFSGNAERETINEQLRSLPGNLEPIAYNRESSSYVIQLQDTRERIGTLKSQLEPLDFYLVGRFAEWEYYNMDMAMLSAMNVCDHF